MKILSALTYLTAICWLALGCNGIFEPEKWPSYLQQVRNESTHRIVVTAYHEDSSQVKTELLVGQVVEEQADRSRFSVRFGSNDSIHVVFDDSVLVAHRSTNLNELDRHMMSYSSWEYDTLEETRHGPSILMEYTFTNADFEEALEKGIKIE